MRPGPGANKLQGVFQIGTCQHKCPYGRMSTASPPLPRSGCYQSLCPQSELKLPLWETLQDQWVGLKPCYIQITTSSLGLEHVRFCMCPLRVELYFPQPFVPHKSKLHWPSEPDILVTHVPNAGLQNEEPSVGLRPIAP